MPTYDYLCRGCGAVTEVIHSMLEPGPTACELCGGELRRVLFPTGIIFKGSGFYRNDARSPDAGSAAKGTGDAAAPPARTDAGGAESAPATSKPSGDAPTTGASSE